MRVLWYLGRYFECGYCMAPRKIHEYLPLCIILSYN